MGKFKFSDDSWESGTSFDHAEKSKISQYLLSKKSLLRQKIKELG